MKCNEYAIQPLNCSQSHPIATHPDKLQQRQQGNERDLSSTLSGLVSDHCVVLRALQPITKRHPPHGKAMQHFVDGFMRSTGRVYNNEISGTRSEGVRVDPTCYVEAIRSLFIPSTLGKVGR